MSMDLLTDANLRKKRAILEGDTELLPSLLDYFSNECLSSDKISKDEWALHSLHPVAFQDETRLEFTKKVIKKYVDAGWDVNSVSTSMTHVEDHLFCDMEKFNLLHLVCLYEGHVEIIKFLVEDGGAHLNCKTTGQLELTPLQILLTLRQWDSASYLIDKGADLKLVGRFKAEVSFMSFAERSFYFDSPDLRSDTCQNAVELLVRMGHEGGLPVLDHILARTDTVTWQGPREFHLALEGTNPNHVAKVLQHCSKMISTADLGWITLRGCRGGRGTILEEKVPSRLWLFHTIHLSPMTHDAELRPDADIMNSLAHLVNISVELGYDLNLSWGSITLMFAPPLEPLIFYALRIGFFHGSNTLLRIILSVDHLQLSGVTGSEGRNPVEYLLQLSDDRSWYYRHFNERTLVEHLVEAVKLLVGHGLDVTGMVMGPHFRYYCGFKDIIQMLYRSGTEIEEDCLSPAPTLLQTLETSGTAKALSELKEWKEEFDQRNQMSLKNICRLRVRKILKRVGDLKMLDQLPVHLKEAVLGNTDL